MSQYTLVVSGDIEQAIFAFHARGLDAVVVQAYYDEGCHKTALKIRPEPADSVNADHDVRGQLETWKAERGTTGQLCFYSPYFPVDGPFEAATQHHRR